MPMRLSMILGVRCSCTGSLRGTGYCAYLPQSGMNGPETSSSFTGRFRMRRVCPGLGTASLRFVHDLVRLKHQLSNRCSTVGIEPCHTQAERNCIARLQSVYFPQILK